MKPPLWKKYLSYLMEFHIEDAPSELNPHLHLCLNNGRYQLCTENAVYSYSDLYNNFSEAFARLDLENGTIQKVLILGFGLGSIPIILEKMGKQYEYTAIEIDEQVIYLASKYELPYLSSPIQLICADASIWIEQATEKFDMIAIDLFLDVIIPGRFKQTDFLTKAKNLLNDNGLLLFNCLAYTEQDQIDSKRFFETNFLKVFPKGRCLKVQGNYVLVNR